MALPLQFNSGKEAVMFLQIIADLCNEVGYWFWDTGEAIAVVWWVGPALAAPFHWVAFRFWDLHFWFIVGDEVIHDLVEDVSKVLSWDKIKQKIGWEFPGIWDLFSDPTGWIRRKLIDYTFLTDDTFDRPWDWIINLLCDWTGLQSGFFHYPLNWIQTKVVELTPFDWEFWLQPGQFFKHKLIEWTSLTEDTFERPWDWIITTLCDWTGLESGFFHYPLNWIQTKIVELTPFD